MDPDNFLKLAKDPGQWRDKAISLRASADAVWDIWIGKFLESIDKEKSVLTKEKCHMHTMY